MLYTYTNTVPAPSAFVTVNKQRLRQNGKLVYMKDQTEFEIELYNPTKEKIMAMIEMNGTPISGSGIILKPGQRVFLERFLDEEKKFLYETYVVDNNKETKDTEKKFKIKIKANQRQGTADVTGDNKQILKMLTDPDVYGWDKADVLDVWPELK